MFLWNFALDPGDRHLSQYITAFIGEVPFLPRGIDVSVIQELGTPARLPFEENDRAGNQDFIPHKDLAGVWATTEDNNYKTITPGPYYFPHYLRFQKADTDAVSSRGALTGAITLDLGIDSPYLGHLFQNVIMHRHLLSQAPEFSHESEFRPYVQFSAASIASTEIDESFRVAGGGSVEIGTHESIASLIGGASLALVEPWTSREIHLGLSGTLEYGASFLFSNEPGEQTTGFRALGELGISLRIKESWSVELGWEADYPTATPSLGHTRGFIGVSWGRVNDD